MTVISLGRNLTGLASFEVMSHGVFRWRYMGCRFQEVLFWRFFLPLSCCVVEFGITNGGMALRGEVTFTTIPQN